MVELITVVVPVYNVENYVDRCVESIVRQTYINLEIILVDDGSVDKSAKKCDEWAQRDERIRVIHKSNGGLSDARNTGINESKGKYIAFIDGDDEILPNMIERLYISLCMADADISMCRMEKIERLKRYPTREFPSDEDALTLTNVHAMRLLFKDVIDCSACLKLYKKELFIVLRFPYGKTNEDFALMYQLFYQAKKIIYISDILYCYYYRENSITTTTFNEKSFDKYYNCVDMLLWIKKNCPEVLKEGRHYLHMQTIFLLKALLINGIEKDYLQQYRQLKGTVRKETLFILFSKYKTFKEKMSMLFMGWFPKIYKKQHKN